MQAAAMLLQTDDDLYLTRAICKQCHCYQPGPASTIKTPKYYKQVSISHLRRVTKEVSDMHKWNPHMTCANGCCAPGAAAVYRNNEDKKKR